MHINGNLTTGSDCGLEIGGYNVTIEKNATFNANLNINSGSFTVNGNLTINNNYGRITMSSDNSVLTVNGNFTHSGGYYYNSALTKGEMYIKGNCIINNNNFLASGTHKIILNGSEKQTVTFGTSINSTFNKVVLANTSDDGVEFTTVVNFTEIENQTNCKLTFPGGGQIGQTLTSDLEVDEYYLVAGVLDLNGHKLTVNGDFVQGAGEVIIGGGTLDIKGNYLIQSKKIGTNGSVTYDASTGFLNMTNTADKVIVAGDFVMGSNKDHLNKLTAGTLTIGGNFSQNNNSSYNFRATDSHKTVFTGDKTHTVYFYSTGSYFQNLDITSETINATNYLNVNGEISCENAYLPILQKPSDLLQQQNFLTHLMETLK